MYQDLVKYQIETMSDLFESVINQKRKVKLNFNKLADHLGLAISDDGQFIGEGRDWDRLEQVKQHLFSATCPAEYRELVMIERS